MDRLWRICSYAAAVMLGNAYGHSPTSLSDEYVKQTEVAVSLAIEGGGPSSILVDFFPICERTTCDRRRSSRKRP